MPSLVKKKYRMLGECLLIYSLQSQALRTLVDMLTSRGFPGDSTCVSKLSLVNLIAKDANLVFPLFDSSN